MFLTGGEPGSAEALALAASTGDTGFDALDNDAALVLSENAHHLEHRRPGWRAGVEPLLMQIEADTFGMELGEESYEVLQASSKAINTPGGDHVEFFAGDAATEQINTGALVAALGAANPLIGVDGDDFPAVAIGDCL